MILKRLFFRKVAIAPLPDALRPVKPIIKKLKIRPQKSELSLYSPKTPLRTSVISPNVTLDLAAFTK